jgi:hypothetical protein
MASTMVQTLSGTLNFVSLVIKGKKIFIKCRHRKSVVRKDLDKNGDYVQELKLIKSMFKIVWKVAK